MNSSVKTASPVHSEVRLLVLMTFFYGYSVIYIPEGGGDFTYWIEWAVYLKEHGIRHIYDLHTHPAPGQPPSFIYGPVYIYMLYFYDKWQGSVEQIRQNIHQLKSIILLFDMVGIWFALRYLREQVNRPFYALFFLFNVSLLYNTVSWGQVDGAIACLTLAAVYFALRGQLVWSGIVLVVALLIKPQPIIFLPVLGLLWLPTVLAKPMSYTLFSVLLTVAVVLVLLFPFIQAGTLVNYWAMLLDSDSIYPTLTVYAANLWTLLFTDNTDKISDQIIWFGLRYKQWGLLLFSVSYFVILLPLLRQFILVLQEKRTGYDTSLVLLTAGLVPLVFYFFNTQMHERYAHVSVLLLGAYALSKGDFIPYVVASIANFWVMDKFLKVFGLHSLYDYITLELVAALFLFVLVWGVVQLYRKPVSVNRDVALV